MGTISKIKERLENADSVTDIIDAILLVKDSADQYTKQYNQGVKNGESTAQAIISATIATLAYYGMERHPIAVGLSTLSEIITSDDKTQLIKQNIVDDINGIVDKAFDYFGFNNEDKPELEDGKFTNNNNPTYKMQDDENKDEVMQELKEKGIENVNIDNQTYKIENGNTVWDIAQKNNTTVDELIKLNPWLKDNMSDDKSWILIKPGQTIELPQSDEQRSTDSGLEYNSQQAQQIIIDPLALDLNHNGKIDTINANSSNTFFDMDNNGMSEITGWIDKEDGLLVYDKNNNGKIDNINELFGNENKDGYSELRELINSNGDNVIDKNDTKFKDLKIWQDINGDGISQSNELKTLDELNITSINLNSKNTNIDDNGNNIFKTSIFTQNGQEYLSGDVNFAVDKRFTDFRGDYTLSVDALFLPWLRGYGDVKDAHIAYSMDEEFKEFTKTLVNDEQKAYNEFDTYLKKWSGLDKVHSANGITRDTLTMDDKVWIMETLSGEDFFKSRIETAYSNNRNSSNRYDTGYIDEQYNNLKTKNYSIFASQSFYKDGFNKINILEFHNRSVA